MAIDGWFQYLIADVPAGTSVEVLKAYLDRAGHLGWELVSIRDQPSAIERYVFKRAGWHIHTGLPAKTW